jgi:hypothetical protein
MRDVSDFFFRKIPRGLPDILLFFGHLKIHKKSPFTNPGSLIPLMDEGSSSGQPGNIDPSLFPSADSTSFE